MTAFGGSKVCGSCGDRKCRVTSCAKENSTALPRHMNNDWTWKSVSKQQLYFCQESNC